MRRKLKRKCEFFKRIFYHFFEKRSVFLSFFGGVIFGYFVELFGQVTFPVAMQLRLEAVFAKLLNNVLFAQLKIQIDKRHQQGFDAYQNQQKQGYVPFKNHKSRKMTTQK